MLEPEASQLTIYLTRDCPSCETARMVAGEVTHTRPDIQVKLVFLDDGEIPPPSVFGVPTYVWRDEVVSLGNPRLDDLLRLFDDATAKGATRAVPNR